MSRLLSAKVIAIGQHTLQDGPISNGCSDQIDPVLLHGRFKPEITHDGSDNGIAIEPAASLQVQGKRGQRLVSVYHLTLFRHEHGPVGVSVQRNTNVAPTRANGLLQSLRAEGSIPRIDVRAIGFIPDDVHFSTQFPYHFRKDRIPGTVRTVYDHLHPLTIHFARQRPFHEFDIASFGIGDAKRLSDFIRRRTKMFDLVR